MNAELKEFLARNHASESGLARLAATGAATPEEAWERADASDLIWAVTRPGVMSDDQRRRFLAEAVLAPIEHLLTDERSKNILQKLRTNEPITAVDEHASWAASQAAEAAEDADASCAASYAAAEAASWAEVAAADEYASWAAERAADATSWAAAAAERASYAAASREAQAGWLRKNFVFSDLSIE